MTCILGMALTGFKKSTLGYSRTIKRENNSYASALNYATDISYHAAGLVSSFTYGNGLVETVGLNQRNLPVSKLVTGNNTPLNYSYSYDANNNISSFIDNRVNDFSLTSMTYDGLDRLTSTIGGDLIGSSQITYDRLGNIKTYNTLNRDLTYYYDTSNKLTSISSTGTNAKPYSSFIYDDKGNITNNSYRQFTYNLAGNMIASGSNQYYYDSSNRRVKQVDSKGTSYSFYSQSKKLLYREKSTGGINYIYLNNALIAKDGAGNTAKSAIPSPTVSINCSPSSCISNKSGTGSNNLTVTLNSNCENGCSVQWSSTNPFFDNDTGANPKTYSQYCRNINQSFSGQIQIEVTDTQTGVKTTTSKFVELNCKVSSGGGGGIEPLRLGGRGDE